MLSSGKHVVNVFSAQVYLRTLDVYCVKVHFIPPERLTNIMKENTSVFMSFSLRWVKSVIVFIYNNKAFSTTIESVYTFELAVTSIVLD